MATHIIPVSNYGNRTISWSPDGTTRYFFRTYYSDGMIPVWLLDILDVDGIPLAMAIPLVPGTANLIKGYGDKFPEGAQLVAVLTDGDEKSPDALGEGLQLVWFTDPDENPYKIGDPLVDVRADDFTFQTAVNGDHSLLGNRFISNQHNILAIQGLQEELDNRATLNQLAQKPDEAPIDNQVYGRKNMEWVPVSEGGGGQPSADNDFFRIVGSSLRLKAIHGGGTIGDSFHLVGSSLRLKRIRA